MWSIFACESFTYMSILPDGVVCGTVVEAI